MPEKLLTNCCPKLRAGAALLCAAAFFLAQAAAAGAGEPYRVAAILPLSGNGATVGQPIAQAMQLAFDALPLGNRRLELVFEDDQGLPANSVTAFQKLLAANAVNAAIVFGSATGNSIAPLAERAGIILIALVASDKKVWTGRKYVFSHWMPLEAQAHAMVAEIKTRNYQRLAMVSHEQEGINAIDSVFWAELGSAGLQRAIVLREKFLMETNDFSSFIAKARTRSVDGIYVVMMPGPSVFAKQARRAGVQAEFFGVQTFENQSEVQAAEGALAGSWYVNADNARDSFQQAFTARFGRHPGIGTANAYDTIMLLQDAVRSGGVDKNRVAEFLNSLHNYDGACGNYSATGDNRFDLPVAVKEVTSDGFRKLLQRP